ncbi:MAG: DUF4845 domain-containing protein, partial [Gammaproteobacteria bacterium]
AVGLLALGVLLAFWVLIIVKLVPVYLEGRSVKSVFERYEEDYAEFGTDKRRIQGYFERFFQVNAVYAVNPRDINIEIGKKDITVTLDYEARVPFVSSEQYGDLWVVVEFKNKAVVPRGSSE